MSSLRVVTIESDATASFNSMLHVARRAAVSFISNAAVGRALTD
jgi:hypothetical protein